MNEEFVKNRPENFIERIERLGGKYPSDSGLLIQDQLAVCEAILEATPVSDNFRHKKRSDNPKEEIRGKRKEMLVNDELVQSKLRANFLLRRCNYKTSPKEVAEYLETILGPPRKQGHWLYIAQNWPPRPIIRVLDYMNKIKNDGSLTIKTSEADYFTFLIKKRKQRKIVNK